MKKFKVKIEGIAPILQARHPSPKEEEEILKRSKTAGKKLKDMTDEEKFDLHAYKNNKGKFIQPSEMIKASMVKAGVAFKFQGKKTYKDAVKAGIIIDPVELVHKHQKCSKKKTQEDKVSDETWHMDARWGKNPNTRGAIWVVRPRLNKWELDFTIILVNDEVVSDEAVRAILEHAGLYVGIGAWRPDFGRFVVKEFKEMK